MNILRDDEKQFCEFFSECFDYIKSEGNAKQLHGLFHDSAGFLLVLICDAMPHPPAPNTIANVHLVITRHIGKSPAIVYFIMHDPSSIGENAFLFLVRTSGDKLRLFTLETHRGKYFLCEYSGNSHINYGEATPEGLDAKLSELLENNS